MKGGVRLRWPSEKDVAGVAVEALPNMVPVSGGRRAYRGGPCC